MSSINEIKKDGRYAILASVLVATIQVKLLDMLEKTTYYKHGVKMACKRVVKELELHIIPDVGLVWGENDKVMYHIVHEMEMCIDRLAKLPPEHYETVSIMIDALLANPDDILSKLKIVEK